MIDRKFMWKIITVTMVALAAAIIITAVGGGIMLAVDLLPEQSEDSSNPFTSVYNYVMGIFTSDGEDDGKDTTPPRISCSSDAITISTNGTVSFKKYVTVSDNSGGQCVLDVDTSKVDQKKAGEYTVTYRATDPSGNVSKLTVKVIVIDSTYSEDDLMTLVAQVAKRELGYTKEEAKSFSKEKIVKDIYNFVKDPSASASDANIVFDDKQSNDPNQFAQNGQKNREGWKHDWIDEAYITLSMSRMKGDCYTYYAVSKAFFEYFGIENVGIQRDAKSSQSGTHYWNVVNIGTKDAPKWYYYDGTRLGGKFSDGTGNSCLITETKLLSYLTRNGESGFYMVDKKNTDFFDAEDNGGVFPTIETKALS